MRVRGWRVGTLAEFLPDEANLLGLNIDRGRAINLRLRYPGDDTQFLPFENVLDTMLHELCHIVHGPHDQAFHALWDKLRDEQETLLRKGYTGEGFLGKGSRLGGRGVPRHELQRQARSAAERRSQAAVLARGSGTKLGGQGIVRGQNPREIIAAAAERRTRVTRGCGSEMTGLQRKIEHEQATSKDKFATTRAEKADEDEAALMQAYIDIIQEEDAKSFGVGYVPPSQENPIGGFSKGNSVQPPPDLRKLREEQLQIERQVKEQSRTNSPMIEYEPGAKSKPKPPVSSSSTPASQRKAPTPAPARLPHEEQTWTCEICTLVNPINHLLCGACETERPSWASPPTNAKRRSQTNSSSSRAQAYNIVTSRTSAADNIARFESAARQKAQMAPAGWSCGGCRNWMESQWWTCSVCGRMKQSS